LLHSDLLGLGLIKGSIDVIDGEIKFVLYLYNLIIFFERIAIIVKLRKLLSMSDQELTLLMIE